MTSTALPLSPTMSRTYALLVERRWLSAGHGVWNGHVEKILAGTLIALERRGLAELHISPDGHIAARAKEVLP